LKILKIKVSHPKRQDQRLLLILGCHQEFLLDNLRRRWAFGLKGEFKVAVAARDGTFPYFFNEVCEESVENARDLVKTGILFQI
jgi:hypothetical protein